MFLTLAPMRLNWMSLLAEQGRHVCPIGPQYGSSCQQVQPRHQIQLWASAKTFQVESYVMFIACPIATLTCALLYS